MLHVSQRLPPLCSCLRSGCYRSAVATALSLSSQRMLPLMSLSSQRLLPLSSCLRSGCHRSVFVFAAVATALSQRLPPLSLSLVPCRVCVVFVRSKCFISIFSETNLNNKTVLFKNSPAWTTYLSYISPLLYLHKKHILVTNVVLSRLNK